MGGVVIPIPPKVKRTLSLAGAWLPETKCLMCGAPAPQMEHAIYETADGRQGMGAKRSQELWAIIPSCDGCNRNAIGEQKRRNALQALRVGFALGRLSEAQVEYMLALEKEFRKAGFLPRERTRWWANKLREAEAL